MASWLKTLPLAVLLLAGACGTCSVGSERAFGTNDRFAFRNELRWTYHFDDEGRPLETTKTVPRPEYDLHCFPMVRAAREFFYHARFAPALPQASAEEYRRKVRAIVARDSRCPSAEDEKVVIPGYGSLAEFSADREALLKDYCGTKVNSYTQRGNWRMILPFSRRHQARMAASLHEKLERGLLPIVHLADFPRLKINHALLLTRAEREGSRLRFEAYDPNDPTRTATLAFDSRTREFIFERNNYFAGGPVNVYEVYKDALF